jgi:hypothetical protein
MNMSVMKVRYEKRGGHYHCTIFTARAAAMTYANCGSVVFDEREWDDMKLIMSGATFEEKKYHEPPPID